MIDQFGGQVRSGNNLESSAELLEVVCGDFCVHKGVTVRAGGHNDQGHSHRGIEVRSTGSGGGTVHSQKSLKDGIRCHPRKHGSCLQVTDQANA